MTYYMADLILQYKDGHSRVYLQREDLLVRRRKRLPHRVYSSERSSLAILALQDDAPLLDRILL